MKVWVAIWVMGLLVLPAQGAEVQGSAKVTDGDSLRISGVRIRLFGIDAPELRQRCQDAEGADYACGVRAHNALRRLINGQPVRCVRVDVDRYNRWVSDCFVGSTHLNQQMVLQGQAVAYRRYSNRHVDSEQQARDAKRGLWQGRFVSPERWRRQNR